MSDIKLTGTFNGERKNVVLHNPNGAGNDDMYHVMVNGFYYGRMWKTENFGWQNDVKPPFTNDDIEKLIDTVSKKIPNV